MYKNISIFLLPQKIIKFIFNYYKRSKNFIDKFIV